MQLLLWMSNLLKEFLWTYLRGNYYIVRSDVRKVVLIKRIINPYLGKFGILSSFCFEDLSQYFRVWYCWWPVSRLPNWRFQKIRLECKRNATFRIVPMEKFREKLIIWNVVPVFPDGMFQTEIRVPFLDSHLRYQFQAFATIYLKNGTDLCKWYTRFRGEMYQSWPVHGFCLPFTQTVTDWFADVNGKINHLCL